MCDYSLHNVKTRPAQVGDKLTTRKFDSGTRGFSAPEDINVAVCLLPGTELSFTHEVRRIRSMFFNGVARRLASTLRWSGRAARIGRAEIHEIAGNRSRARR